MLPTSGTTSSRAVRSCSPLLSSNWMSSIVPGVSHINKYDWLVQNMTWLATWSRLGKAKWLTATGQEYDWRRRLRIVKARLQYYVHAINCNKSSRNVRLIVLLDNTGTTNSLHVHLRMQCIIDYRLELQVVITSYSRLKAHYTKCCRSSIAEMYQSIWLLR